MTTSLEKCRFTAAAGGTADFVVGSSITGCNLPSAAGAEDGVAYRYISLLGNQWEMGSGSFDLETSTVVRASISASSDNDAKVDFEAAPVVCLTEAINVGVRDGSNVWSGSNTFNGAVTVDVNNFTDPVKVDGSQVVGDRKAGWTVPTGTVQRSGFATYTAPTIGDPVLTAHVQAMADNLQAVSRTLAALIADIHATNGHGLIGT